MIYFCKNRKLKGEIVRQWNMYNESAKFQGVSHHTEAIFMPFLLIWIHLEKYIILFGLSVPKSKVAVNIFQHRNWKILFSLWCSLKNFIFPVNLWYYLYT